MLIAWQNLNIQSAKVGSPKLNNIKENPSNIKETLTLQVDKILHRHHESIWLSSSA